MNVFILSLLGKELLTFLSFPPFSSKAIPKDKQQVPGNFYYTVIFNLAPNSDLDLTRRRPFNCERFSAVKSHVFVIRNQEGRIRALA